MIEAVLEGAILGLSGGLQHLSVDVYEPAVVTAADASLLDLAVFKRRAAVRAVGLHEPDAAAFVAKDDQLLAEPHYCNRQVLKLPAQEEGLPEATKVLASWCTGADPGQLAVILGYLPVEIAAIGLGQEWGPLQGHSLFLLTRL